MVITLVVCNIPETNNPFQQIVPCLKIINDLEREFNESDFPTFDMKTLNWVCPFSSLILGSKIHELFAKREKNILIIPPENKTVDNHLNRIGFPTGGNSIIATSLPIIHFFDNPDKNCENLFKFVKESFPSSLRGNCISCLLGELVDNVDQHSRYTHASITAQFFPKMNIVDIGVVDNGISIPKLFKENNINFKDDADAIRLAMNGKSTKPGDERGYGLYTTRRITTEGLKGKCFILSGNGVLVSDSKKSNTYTSKKYLYKGTLIYLRFFAPKEEINIYPFLER